MIKTLHIFLIVTLFYSCSEVTKNYNSKNWNRELIGVGYIGLTPDSLKTLFSYYPCENNQPELLNHYFKYSSKISGDTITIPNLILHDFFHEIEIDNRISKGTSTFKIKSFEGLIQFSKINGHAFIPEKIYFKKYPNKYPNNFKYQFYSGYDRWDNFNIEINGNSSVKIWLKGNADNPYLFEQNNKSEIDDLFISSYLNLICHNRYDTISLKGVFIHGAETRETLIYNDSTFNYSTYFNRLPDGGLLVNYFRSKLDKRIHGLNEFNYDLKSSIKAKSFKELPIALESWENNAPPPSRTQ